jgi:glycosyltransferase involved in cell wall biosynthesis
MQPQPGPNAPVDGTFKVLIVADLVSAVSGGEAILPLHYFRLLRERGFGVWLVTHARTREELTRLFPGEPRIFYIEDSALDKAMWWLTQRLPARVGYVTTGFVSRVAVQIAQARLVRQLVRSEGIDLVHQPVPVSPREPSLVVDVGAPVVIGPMNGGMDYPPAFRHRGRFENLVVALGRFGAYLMNTAMPGKRRAALLLVANARTRAALPRGVCLRIEEVVENGVELGIWNDAAAAPSAAPAGTGARAASPHGTGVRAASPRGITQFAFIGRLVGSKAVDLLLEAFAAAAVIEPMRLLVIGEGDQREALQRQAARLFPSETAEPSGGPDALIRFTGWLSQADCARELTQVDALVMPSLFDCGGAVVLEAMAMGLPVIATAWGGPVDYLDETCGILVPPRDRASLVDGLAQAMVRLANAPHERAAMGSAGRAKIAAVYSWDVKATRMIEIYREVLGRAAPAATAPASAPAPAPAPAPFPSH